MLLIFNVKLLLYTLVHEFETIQLPKKDLKDRITKWLKNLDAKLPNTCTYDVRTAALCAIDF